MDFEEQLEKAEKLSSPSLVGASIRSADDSAHNNYIHPEKSRSSSRKREKSSRSSRLSNLAMSLDELMNEGALLGSEENFESYLDDEGHVKEDIISAGSPEHEQSSPLKKEIPDHEDTIDSDSKQGVLTAENASPENVSEGTSVSVSEDISKRDYDDSNRDDDKSSTQLSKASVISEIGETGSNDFSSGVLSENSHLYSTPNLSEYQLDHQITDHLDLLKNIQSHEPHRLPINREYNTSNQELNKPRKKDIINASPQKDSQVYDNSYVDNVLPIRSGLHTPYFQTDSRDTSRARSVARSQERSRSKSAMRPHLARGDSYKNTHVTEPAKYELPAELQNEAELQEVDESFEERTTREAKPTMGDSIAAAESGNANAFVNPSLVTTGDYTNFNVDSPEPNSLESFFTRRSLSSTNYLRSISRSRSVAHDNEKNDANIDNLVEEGALVNDDPYSTINELNEMVENVLHTKDVTTKQSDNETKEIDEGGSAKETSDNVEPIDPPELEQEDEVVIEESNNQTSKESEEIMNATDVKDKTNPAEAAETREVEYMEEKPSTRDPIEGLNTSKNLDLAEEKVSETTGVTDKAAEETTELIRPAIDQEKNEDLVSSNLPEETEKTEKSNIVESNIAKEGNGDKEVTIDSFENKEKEEEEIEKKHVEGLAQTIEPNSPLVKKEGSIEFAGSTNATESEEGKNNEDQNEEEDLEREVNTKEIREENAGMNTSTETDDKKGETKNLIHDSTDDAFTKEVSEIGADEKETPENTLTQEETPEISLTQMVSDIPIREKKTTENASTQEDSDTEVHEKETPADALPQEIGDIAVHEKKTPVDALTQEDNEIEDHENETLVDEVEKEKSTVHIAQVADKEGEIKDEIDVIKNKDDLQIRGSGDATLNANADESKEKGIEEDVSKNITTEEHNSSSTDADKSIKSELKEQEDNSKTMELISTKDEDDLDDLDINPEDIRKHLESQPVFLFTSFAGGMQVMTRTNRLATILQGNGVKFTYRDLGTDEEAKKLWKRYGKGKMLPGVVRGDDVIGNFNDIEEINEEYRLLEVLYETL